MAYLSPMLNEGQYDYQAPADIKDWALIDVRRIAGRQESDKFDLVTTEYFDRNKGFNKNLICIEDRDFLKKLRISANTRGSDEAIVHDMESVDDDGTWSTILDATNIRKDTDHFIHGESSLKFSMDQSATTVAAGYIENSDFDAVDLSDYEENGSVFVWVFIPSDVTLASLQGFTLRIGSSSTVYFEGQITATNEALDFYAGWNLLRFDFASMTETGTVDMDNIDYVRLAVDRPTGDLEAKDWRVDFIVARRGKPHETWYYTNRAWQTSAGVYIADSTVVGDLLNVDTDFAYEGFILKGKEIVAMDLKQFDDMKIYRQLYEDWKKRYELSYPSEKLLILQSYRNFNDSPGESWLN
jgi:hypothetical protein